MSRLLIGKRLSDQFGTGVEVVSADTGVNQQVRGLAFCSGRIMSYVFDARTRSLQTRAILELSRRSRESS